MPEMKHEISLCRSRDLVEKQEDIRQFMMRVMKECRISGNKDEGICSKSFSSHTPSLP